MLEVVDRILGFMGKSSLKPVVLNEASGEIPDQYLDCTKAHQALNWRARYAFEVGLAETIPWYAERLEARVKSTLALRDV